MQELEQQALGLMDKIPSAGKVDFIHKQPKALSITAGKHKELTQRTSLQSKGSLQLKNPLIVSDTQRLVNKLNSIDHIQNKAILKSRFMSNSYRQPMIFEQNTQRRSLESSDNFERKLSHNSGNVGALSSATSRIINIRNGEEDAIRYRKKTQPKFHNEFRNTLKECGATAYQNRQDVYNHESKYGGNNIFKNYN